MIGGLVTSTLFTLLALPAFYLFVHELGSVASDRGYFAPAGRRSR
jgi:Cu/Ag efflux pump CusA